MVNLQINKLGHYNNKLIFFKVQQPLSKYLQQYLKVPLQNNAFFFHITHTGYLCLSQQAFLKEKSMHKWVISIKVLRAVWKVNTTVYSQLYLRQMTTNFQLIMDNIPVVSNSCLKKKKKKIQELISDADELPSMSLASERIENQPKGIWMRKILVKEYVLRHRCGADCARHVLHVCVHTHTHTLTRSTHIFPVKLQVEWDLYSKVCKGLKALIWNACLSLFWLKSHKNTFNRKT